MRNNALSGARVEPFYHFHSVAHEKYFAGELPLGIILMKAKSIIRHYEPPEESNDYNGEPSGLSGNLGFTLPANIGEFGDDITELNLADCSLTGVRVASVLPLSLLCFDCCILVLRENSHRTSSLEIYRKTDCQPPGKQWPHAPVEHWRARRFSD